MTKEQFLELIEDYAKARMRTDRAFSNGYSNETKEARLMQERGTLEEVKKELTSLYSKAERNYHMTITPGTLPDLDWDE